MAADTADTSEATLPPAELFHYSAAHKVLICTACRYAIQPAAIARHLKEIHHLYRGARRPYMEFAATLELVEPQNAKPPELSSQFPVAHLPVEQGWRCTAAGCEYMCVSMKRMEVHWPAVHGRKGCETGDWTACPLQTFFRGNMLKYFTAQPASNPGVTALQYPHHEVVAYHKQHLKALYFLDAFDSSLLEHYFSLTYKNFTLSDDGSIPIWLETVPKLAADHAFLLHGLLACTALHMASLDSTMNETYTLRACAHQETAIPLFRYAIENPSHQNCNALVVFAYLLIVYAFATDVDNINDSLLLVDDDGSEWVGEQLILPQWLHFIRAGCSMLCDVWDSVETGPVRSLAYAWDVELVVGDGQLPYVDYFVSIIPKDSSWSPKNVSTYVAASIALAETFAHLNNAQDNSDFTTWQVLGCWPARVEDAYVKLLSQRFPGALILLAYFCVILKRIDGLWYFKGRPAKLLRSITHALDERWHPFIREPVHKVLGAGEMLLCT